MNENYIIQVLGPRLLECKYKSSSINSVKIEYTFKTSALPVELVSHLQYERSKCSAVVLRHVGHVKSHTRIVPSLLSVAVGGGLLPSSSSTPQLLAHRHHRNSLNLVRAEYIYRKGDRKSRIHQKNVFSESYNFGRSISYNPLFRGDVNLPSNFVYLVLHRDIWTLLYRVGNLAANWSARGSLLASATSSKLSRHGAATHDVVVVPEVLVLNSYVFRTGELQQLPAVNSASKFLRRLKLWGVDDVAAVMVTKHADDAANIAKNVTDLIP
uniref:Uncharacterized protein n=1 Tax=Glossina austeni TaxID=7395 RepID=A0A1A9VFL0_GLOAU